MCVMGGNVGIGLANPGELLHVNGSINVTSGNDVCITGGNCLSDVSEGNDTHVAGDGIYLYNDSFDCR